MRYLNGVYTQHFNRKHSRVGHVFQGRYKAILVEKEPYLQELSRYIALNPVRADMTESAERWEWSSYAATAGLVSMPSWFDRRLILGSFGKQQSSWAMLKNQIYLSLDKFVEGVQMNITDKNIPEVPKIQKRSIPKALQEYAANTKSRNEAVQLAYRSGGYTLEAIGKYYGLHYSTVSRIIHDKIQK